MIGSSAAINDDGGNITSRLQSYEMEAASAPFQVRAAISIETGTSRGHALVLAEENVTW